MKEILINEGDNSKITTALLENGNMVEVYEQEENSIDLEGNIYCGIIRNILPGMQSAFVDINEKKNAFIHIKDILPKESNKTGNKEKKFEECNIQEYIKPNMPILVQVKKNAENKKGARVSKHVNLTGKFTVLMPDVDFITISQKIEDKNEKLRLKKMAEKIMNIINCKNEKYGIIMRTASINAQENEIEEDIKELIKLWKNILIKYNSEENNKKPIKLYNGDTSLLRLITSIANMDKLKIITNSPKQYDEIKEEIKSFKKAHIQIELKNDSLMNMYNLQEQLEKIKERKVWLKCGGFITIDRTEALTAIDINSGKFTGKKNSSKDENIYKVNEEATIEIAKQLRLRNISGIIVIDYIDMENEEDRKRICELFKRELKKDRSKTQIVGFTKLDLLEMTRKKL